MDRCVRLEKWLAPLGAVWCKFWMAQLLKRLNLKSMTYMTICIMWQFTTLSKIRNRYPCFFNKIFSFSSPRLWSFTYLIAIDLIPGLYFCQALVLGGHHRGRNDRILFHRSSRVQEKEIRGIRGENLAWKQVAIKPPKTVKNLSGGQESQYSWGIQHSAINKAIWNSKYLATITIFFESWVEYCLESSVTFM